MVLVEGLSSAVSDVPQQPIDEGAHGAGNQSGDGRGGEPVMVGAALFGTVGHRALLSW